MAVTVKFMILLRTPHEKLSFPLKISLVNVTKFAVSCRFALVTFTEEILCGKLCAVNDAKSDQKLIQVKLKNHLNIK